MSNSKINYKLVNILLLITIFYIIVVTSNYWGSIILRLFNIIFPFFLAFVLAYILDCFVKKLEEKNINRNLSIIIVILITLILIIGLLILIIPAIYEQLISFTKTIPEVMSYISNRFNINLHDIEKIITNNLNEVTKTLGTYISNGTINVINRSIKFVTNLIVVIIAGIYMLIDMPKIRNTIKNTFHQNKKVYTYIKTLDTEISLYLKGLSIFMIVQLFEYCILFKIINHPNWLLLGVLASVTTVIPYIGGILTNILAIITASVVSSKLFILTLIITLVFPNIDGYIISPYIYRKTTNVNPIIVIFITVLCSGLFGIWGIMLGLPLYMIIRTTWKFFVLLKE